jgi:hypothetical protein
MIQDKIFFDEKDPTGLSYNTPFTVFGSYQGRLWSKAPGGEIKYYTQNSDLSVYATTGSNQFNGNQTVTGSLTVTGGITGTATTASYVQYSNVANKPALVSGSAQVSFTGIINKPSGIVSSSVQVRGYNVFATTGSNQFNGSQSITGSLTVTGQVIAQTLNVQEVTSSIVFSSGSNRFGNNSGNTHRFTGSLAVTGAGTFAGSITLSGTNSQLLQTTSNSIAGDNAAVFYNSNANSYGLYIGAGSGTNHSLYITDSTRTKDLFKVAGNGNVGIGTASPDVTGFGWRTLTIKGGAASGDAGVLELQSPATTGAANLGIIAFLDGSNRNAQIYVQRDSSTTTGNMLFATNGGAGIIERLRITSGGNTEVRSGNILSIYRTDNTRALQLSTNNNECLIDAWAASSEPLMLRSNGAGGRIVFHTNGGERVRITSDGEVNIGGFGTIFPVLTVKGIASSPHIGSTWSVSANQDGTGRTIIGTAGQGRSMYFENNGDIVIPNNSLQVGGPLNINGSYIRGKTVTGTANGTDVILGVFLGYPGGISGTVEVFAMAGIISGGSISSRILTFNFSGGSQAGGSGANANVSNSVLGSVASGFAGSTNIDSLSASITSLTVASFNISISNSISGTQITAPTYYIQVTYGLHGNASIS